MSSKDEQMFIEQIKILYERAVSVIPVNVIIGAILCLFLLPVLSNEQLLSWLALLSGISAIRFVYVKYMLKHADWFKNAKRLSFMFAFLAFLTGGIWCLGFFLFAFKVPDVYLIFIIFALGGMAVGAIASMATSKLSFFSFTFPLLIPPTVVFLFQGSTLGYAMSAMMAIYSFSISLTYVQSYKLVSRGIITQFEKDELIQHLKISKQHLELANEKIMVISHTDELTQVANRRYLDMMLDKEWGRCMRTHAPLTFAMIDIDFFKDYNDTYGHVQGDNCLKKISGLLRDMVKRPGDFVARYGGEEFGIILPDTELPGAHFLMADLQQSLQDLQIPAANTSVSAFVTISVGIACMIPDKENEAGRLVAAADAALYTAKQQGRNRIIMANPSE